MAHFVKVNDNNKVVDVIVVNNVDCENLEFPQSESIGQKFLRSIGFDGKWLQTSYNSKFRKHYAGIGFTYDLTRDAFIPPKPFADAVFDENTCSWKDKK